MTYGLHLLGLIALGSLATADAGQWLEARRGAVMVISLTGLWKYAVVAGLYYAFDYYHRFRAQEREHDRLAVRAAELESRLAHARLDALRSQLHPHFLFNTLNSIAVLSDDDPDRAKRMLLRLSDLLRTVLETDAAEVALDRELTLARQYLDIQRVRYEERLTTDVDVDPDVRDARVPSFLLQPLIENAVRHGVECTVVSGRIRITARRRDAMLRIEVENALSPEPLGSGAAGRVGRDGRDGRREHGASRGRRRGAGRGIGLTNTRERLERMYGNAHRFDAATGEDGTTFLVRIEVPFEPVAAG